MLLKTLAVFFATLFSAGATSAQDQQREFYELRTYYYSGDSIENRLDQYLGKALVPALHRAGIKKVGVFKSSSHDTSSIRRFVVLIPYSSLAWLDRIDSILDKDKTYQNAGNDYINAAHNNAPYSRMEKTILKAFTGLPQAKSSGTKGNKKDRVYELRSYEGATEKLYRTKVKMFNTGDEVGIFDRLGFNAIFYAEVLAGKSMPNLMYMTSFENMDSRNQHWKAFGEDAAWNKLKADKQYDNTVSHIDIWYFYPADYSDY